MADLTGEDIQAVLVSKANIELQNISLRRENIELQKQIVALQEINQKLMGQLEPVGDTLTPIDANGKAPAEAKAKK